MTDWQSIADMTHDLGLKSSLGDTEALRSEIRREIIKVHPDQNGGHFANPEDEARYQQLVAGLEFLGKMSSTALVPIQDITALVVAVREAIQTKQSGQTPEQSRAEFREVARAELQHRLLLPRIGSGAFAATTAYLLANGDKLGSNPILGRGLKGEQASLFLFGLLFYSAVFFVMTWWMEQRASAQYEWLATEAGRRFIFARLLESIYSRTKRDGDTVNFSLSEFVDAIIGPPRRASLFLFMSSKISPAAAEKLAKAHLDELESRGVIRKSNGKQIELVYEMDSIEFELTPEKP